MIRIFIADDHPVVLEGLKRMLATAPEIEVIGQATRGDQTLRFVQEQPPDILLLDMAFPDINGLEVLRSVRQHAPLVKVIMVSMHAEERFGRTALLAGASAYVVKTETKDCLLAAVRAVWAGQRYARPEVIEAFKDYQQRPFPTSGHVTLSPREQEVFILLAQGTAPIRIARELHVTRRTVFAHRSHILEKMQLQNNVELTQYAVRHKLVQFGMSSIPDIPP